MVVQKRPLTNGGDCSGPGLINNVTAGQLEALGMQRLLFSHLKPLSDISQQPLSLTLDGDNSGTTVMKITHEIDLPNIDMQVGDIILDETKIRINNDKAHVGKNLFKSLWTICSKWALGIDFDSEFSRFMPHQFSLLLISPHQNFAFQNLIKGIFTSTRFGGSAMLRFLSG